MFKFSSVNEYMQKMRNTSLSISQNFADLEHEIISISMDQNYSLQPFSMSSSYN